MTFRLLGMTDEEQAAFEETSGIRTEGARQIVEESIRQTREMFDRSVKEVQSVVGPHGAVTRLQAGGVRVTPGLGIGVFEDGVMKTTIKPDGNLLVGSDIEDPRTTSLCVFVNAQTYNNESMGAGDVLIGDNSASTSNVKYDASEGQLQFRSGTTVNVYMDTDGTLKAGGGNVTLDSDGISLVAPAFPQGVFIQWLADDTAAILGQILGWYVAGVASGVYLLGKGKDASHFGVSGLAAMAHDDDLGEYRVLFDIDTNGNAELNLEGANQDNVGEQALVIKTNVAETNAINNALYLDTKSKNTVANGLGTAVAFRMEDSAGNMDTAGYVGVEWTDKTSGSEDSQLAIGWQAGGSLVNGKLISGSWTPTLTNTTNIDASVAHTCYYMRVGNVVTVSGVVEIDATALGAVVMKMSLPVASNFTATEDASGTLSTPGANDVVGSIIPDSTNDVLDFRFDAKVTTNVFYRFMAMYVVK